MSTSFVIKSQDIDQIIDWCFVNFGAPNGHASTFRYDYWMSSSAISWRFFFADADDAVIFKLTWNDFVVESVTV